jgi:hypothetical protein
MLNRVVIIYFDSVSSFFLPCLVEQKKQPHLPNARKKKHSKGNLHGGRLAEKLGELSLGGLERQVADKNLVAILLDVNLSSGSGIAHGYTGRTYRTGWRGTGGGQGTCKGTRKRGNRDERLGGKMNKDEKRREKTKKKIEFVLSVAPAVAYFQRHIYIYTCVSYTETHTNNNNNSNNNNEQAGCGASLRTGLSKWSYH